MRTFLLLVVVVLGLGACPAELEVPAANDAGSQPGPGIELRDFTASGSLRGPIVIQATLASDTDPGEVGLAFLGDEGPQAATVFRSQTQTQPFDSEGLKRWRWVWDSRADFSVNTEVTLVLQSLEDPPQEIDARLTLDLRNDVDNARIVLACHPSAELAEGGVSDVNNQVSVLKLESQGTLVDDQIDLEVGTGPTAVRFSPDASLAVVHNGHDGDITVLDVNIDTNEVSARAERLDFTPASVFDQAFAPDAQTLFVLAGSGTENALYAMAIDDGQLNLEAQQDLDTVAQCLAVSPRGDFVALGRRDPNGDRLLEIFARNDLSLVSATAYPGLLCSRLRFSPNGQWLVATDEFSEHQVSTFYFDGHSAELLDEVGNLTAVSEGIFHPDSGALAVSTLNGNSLQSYLLDRDNGLSLQDSASGGLPLAAEMDIVMRGQRRGLILVSALSSVASVTLDDNGQFGPVTSLSTGDGIAYMVQGLAIQP